MEAHKLHSGLEIMEFAFLDLSLPLPQEHLSEQNTDALLSKAFTGDDRGFFLQCRPDKAT